MNNVDEWRIEPDVWGPEEIAPGVLIWGKRNMAGVWAGYASVPSAELAMKIENESEWGYPQFDVHGGVTWSGEAPDWPFEEEEPGFCLGFDCCHSWDFIPKHPDLGGDTYRNLAFVREQAALLAKQIFTQLQGED